MSLVQRVKSSMSTAANTCSALLASTLCLALTALGCVGVEPRQSDAQPNSDSPDTQVDAVPLSSKGEHYLRTVYLYRCADDYLPYPEGQTPPVPTRSAKEWEQREAELESCLQDVKDEYTELEKIRSMTWDGSSHSIRAAQRQAIAREGPDWLDDYVADLLQDEKRKARASDRTP